MKTNIQEKNITKANKEIDKTVSSSITFLTKETNTLNMFPCYDIKEMTISEMSETYKSTVDNLSVVESLIAQTQKLIDIETDNVTKKQLVSFIKILKDVRKKINQFKKYAKKELNFLASVDLQATVDFLKLKQFNGWDVKLEKWGTEIYNLVGFSNNADVKIRNLGEDSTLQIILKPLHFKDSKKQSEHFQQLFDENKDTVRKAVETWLGDVKNASELDNIIRVQANLAYQKKLEQLAKKEAEYLKSLDN